MDSRKIKTVLVFLLTILAGNALALALFLLAVPNPPKPTSYTYGITFSKLIAEKLELDWRQTYLAILDELGIKTIRLSAYWSEVEPAEGKFDFTDLDWQIAEAKHRGIGVMLAVGQKLPRWPECHYPIWFRNGDEENRKMLSESEQGKLLRYIHAVTNRYKNEPAITNWQVENEPFLPFGICPALDMRLLDKEIAEVRSIDASRLIVVSESGEFSTWLGAARRADVVGSTLYRVVWWKSTGYVRYPIPDWFYWKKIWLIKKLYPNVKDVIVVELQGEPWAHLQIYENTVEEMMKSMSPEQFVENLRFARASRFATQYVWGAEWWHWMKEKHAQPFYWDTAKKIFAGNYRFLGE